MNTTDWILMVSPAIILGIAYFVAKQSMQKNGHARTAFKKHLITLLGGVAVCAVFPAMTFAAEPEAVAAIAESTGTAASFGFIGAALSIGLSAIGAGIALAAGAPAAIGAVSEDPKSFGKAMIFVVLGEAVALYGFVIAFMILSKIPTFAAL